MKNYEKTFLAATLAAIVGGLLGSEFVRTLAAVALVWSAIMWAIGHVDRFEEYRKINKRF